MRLFLTYESIKNYINNEETGNGCKFLMTEEDFNSEKIKQNKNNSHVQLNIECKCKNNIITSFDNFKHTKKQCTKCSGVEKPTMEYIYNFVEKETDCKLLSTEYENAYSILLFKCKCGNEFSKKWTKFYNANQRQCKKCSFIKIGESNKIEYAEIKEFIENQSNCVLLTPIEEYIDTCKFIDILCECGEKFSTTFKQFKSEQSKKRQCDKCGEITRRKNLSIPFHTVKNFIEEDSNSGCTLLTTENNFINSRSLLDIQCKCGDKFSTTYNIFSRNIGNKQQCDKCINIEFRILTKIIYEEVVKIFSDNNCELLTSKDEYYLTDNKKLRYKCSCNNESYITLSKFKEGHRCTKCLRERVKQTNLLRFGVEHSSQNPEISAKQRHTLYKNNTAPCSKQQEYIHKIISGKLNYPVKTSSLDIAFPEEMIYLEYDGGLHEGQVIFGNLSKDDFIKKERNRTYALLRSGWKEIRIISAKDYVPEDDKLLEMITYAKEYLNSGHHYIKFDIDKNIIINSQGKSPYDFGKVRKIKKEDMITI